MHRRYRLEGLAAVGGIACIHVGHTRRDNRRVALKVFHPPEGRERIFLDYMVHEANALKAAASPAVVGLIDHGLWLGYPTLVLEWLEGRSLGDLVAHGPLPMDRVDRLMWQVVSAVETLHANGVVHADLKPGNIMLCPRETGERVRLIDLGAAHVNGVGAAARDEVFGTPGYVAPEVVGGAAVSPSTDVYALGVLLFEMLTGQPPFIGNDLHSVLQQQTRGRLPRAGKLRPARGDVSDALEAVVATALAPSPAQRFRDVRALRIAFEDAILVTARNHTFEVNSAPIDTVDEPTLRCRRPMLARTAN
ncbi:MAG TPA: serine/threonine-protein kinase [Kofleriaceae bacterium]|nr:serine/threonine-protein kinase [Kofleriaceae bacterium]